MIKLSGVHLRYPMMNFVSHSFQNALFNKVGGLLGREGGRGAYQYVEALNNINLELHEGQRLGIIGHNGAGKTSLLRLISGVYPPSKGSVEVRGKISALTNITLGMDPNVSGRKNIIFRLVFMGYSFEQANSAVDEIIEFSELGEFIDLPTRTYSSGMFLRLAFAISTHFAPGILLLDEILSAGDLAFQEKARERVRSLVDKSRIFVLAAHSLETIKSFCNQVLILSHGSIIARGTPDEMVAMYAGMFNKEKSTQESGIAMGGSDKDDEQKLINEAVRMTVQTYIQSGLEHIKAKKWAEAKKAFDDALQVDPKSRSAHHQLGLAELNLGNLDAAEKIFRDLIALCEGKPEDAYWLAEVLIKKNRHSDAVKALQEQIEKWGPQISCLISLGKCCEVLKRWEDAKKAYESALVLDAASVHVRHRLGMVEMQLLNFEAAEELFRGLAADASANAWILCSLADVLWKTRRRYEAVELLENMVERVSEPAVINEKLGVLCYEMNELDKARNACLSALKANPNNDAFRAQLARIECRAGNWTEGKRWFSLILGKSTTPEGWYWEYCKYCYDFNDWMALQEAQCSDVIKYFYHLEHFQNAEALYGDIPGYSEEFLKNIWTLPGYEYRDKSILQRDFESKFVNISDGLRRTTGNPQNAPATVYLFGHSQVYGYLVNDSGTIASCLQEQYNRTSETPLNVVNRSVTGHPVEAQFLQFLRTPVKHGDKVVFFLHNLLKLSDVELERRMRYFLAIFNECLKRGAEFHLVILPMVFHMKHPNTREERILASFLSNNPKADIESNAAVYEFLSSHIPSRHYFSDILDRPHDFGEVLLDGIHWNHRINKVISSRLYPILEAGISMERKSERIVTCADVKPHAVRYLKEDVRKQYGGNSDIAKWLAEVRQSRFAERKTIGAIVMNCNPFTKGHRYLIEQAVAEVDALYLFVVQEDKSFFPFADRMRLVRDGTRDLADKVAVVPSGKFIISSMFFPGYFAKEEAIKAVDSTTDVLIFGGVIAPALNITHRFLGEEPHDVVTKSYNDTMEFLLPDMGVQLHIIPRRSYDDERGGGQPISASTVRAALKGDDFKMIRQLVPVTTYDYLVNLSEDSEEQRYKKDTNT